jgi:hypothetical protein
MEKRETDPIPFRVVDFRDRKSSARAKRLRSLAALKQEPDNSLKRTDD